MKHRLSEHLEGLRGRFAGTLRVPDGCADGDAAASHGTLAMACSVGAIVFSLLYPFVDQNYLANYQFDTPVFAMHVAQFRQALAAGDLSALPKLSVWPTYYDAYDVLLTALTAATAGLGRVSSRVAQALPTVEAQTNFWARWMSLGFHVVGMAFLWMALLRLYARPLVALGLTMLVALAPTVIQIELGRNDWGVLGSLCVVLYFNICIAQGDHRKRVLVGLGVSAALLMTMKLNGLAFAIFVAFPLLAIVLYRGADVGRKRALLGAFVIALVCLSFRQLYYSADFYSNFVAQLEELQRWSAKSPKPSLLYYSWEILASQGRIYRVLVWASVPAVLLSLVLRPSLTALFVFGAFSIFVGWSVVIDYGFPRGGYHLLPLFVLMIATALAALERAFRAGFGGARRARLAAGLVVSALLAEPMAALSKNYAQQASLMFDRPSAVSVTRTLPAQWMAEAFPQGARVATLFGSEPSLLPPIHSLGFVFDESLFSRSTDRFDRDPPPVQTLRSTANVFVVTDYQQGQLFWELESGGHQDKARRWRQWFEMMRRNVPSVVFSAPSPGYYYRSVEVFDLDPATSASALRATLVAIQAPVTVRETIARGLPDTAELPTPAPASEDWRIETHEGSTAMLERSPTQPRQMRVGIARLTGRVPWLVKLNQPGFEIRGGQRYLLAFRVRAVRPRRIACAVGQNRPPWEPLGLYRELDVTAEWTTHEYSFVGAATEADAKIYFDLGFSDIAVELADVVLRDASGGSHMAPAPPP